MSDGFHQNDRWHVRLCDNTLKKAPLVLGIAGEADPIFGCTLQLDITTDLSVK